MIRTIVVGAAGRMGRRLVANIMKSKTLTLAGATEFAESPLIGEDIGIVAGCGTSGIKLSSELQPLLKQADAVIIFSTSGVINAVQLATENGCSAVVGTTALTPADKLQLNELAHNGGRIVSAYNMSVGVNLLFKLVAEATKILGLDYDCEIVEMHHNQKKDAPSGTATRLAEVVCTQRGWDYNTDVKPGRNGIVGARSKHEIGMHSLRGGDVVGDHTVIFSTDGERIELTHKASSRDTFAQGALRAVEFLQNAQPGLYDMQDVLGLK